MSTGPNGRKEGLFLVRESLGLSGNFALTMWARNQVHHVKIVAHGNGCFSFANGPLHESIDELIHYHRLHVEGLPSNLREFVERIPPPHSDTECHRAARYGNVELLKQPLAQPHSVTTDAVNSKNVYGSTPVHEAAKNGQVEVLRVFVEHKADLKIQDTDGNTAVQVWLFSRLKIPTNNPLILPSLSEYTCIYQCD